MRAWPIISARTRSSVRGGLLCVLCVQTAAADRRDGAPTTTRAHASHRQALSPSAVQQLKCPVGWFGSAVDRQQSESTVERAG
jgi:hypothetical protein